MFPLLDLVDPGFQLFVIADGNRLPEFFGGFDLIEVVVFAELGGSHRFQQFAEDGILVGNRCLHGPLHLFEHVGSEGLGKE